MSQNNKMVLKFSTADEWRGSEGIIWGCPITGIEKDNLNRYLGVKSVLALMKFRLYSVHNNSSVNSG